MVVRNTNMHSYKFRDIRSRSYLCLIPSSFLQVEIIFVSQIWNKIYFCLFLFGKRKCKSILGVIDFLMKCHSTGYSWPTGNYACLGFMSDEIALVQYFCKSSEK